MSQNQTSRFARVLSLGLAAAAIIIVALLWALHPRLSQVPGLFDEAKSTPAYAAPVNRIVDMDMSWCELFFTSPQLEPQWRGGLDEFLAADIDLAKLSVDVAAYDLDLQTVTDAMLRAHGRGVRVRLVIDSDNIGLDQPQDLLSAGVPVVEDNRTSLMHNKFIVIDGSITWTGSWNLTDGGTYRNNNHAIRIVSQPMASNYTAEFEEMFLDGAFGRSSPADTPNPVLEIEGTVIEVYFAPEDEAMSQVIQAVSLAEESIRFMAFSFTHEALGASILERAASGVLVEGVFETRNSTPVYSQYTAMKDAELSVWRDGNPGSMHHKVVVIDSHTVFLGSFNLTGSADQDNDENLLIVHSDRLADHFLDEFARLTSQGYP